MPTSNQPLVSLIMGSSSDAPIMKEASQVLDDFGVAHEMKVVSAHRTPEEMQRFALDARKSGIQVIIAGAGGAAHLPGMVASLTSCPVIGVPIFSSNSIEGIDSLLSIVQMPAGVPVATVGIGNAKNAALLAVRILSLGDSTLEKKLDEFKKSQIEKVRKQNESL